MDNNWYAILYTSNFTKKEFEKAFEEKMHEMPACYAQLIVAKYYSSDDKWYGVWKSEIFGGYGDVSGLTHRWLKP